jgi:hypothetical protein
MTEPFITRPPHDATMRREGIVTGLLGAAVVALFYLVIDLLRGRALITPSVLGQGFILHTPVTPTAVDLGAVVAYTVFHIGAFVAFGLLLAALVRSSESSSLARYAVLQVMVAFVVFFYGLLWVGSEVVRGMFSFIGVLAANVLAGGVMVTWLWRHHPALRSAMQRTPLGANNDARA